VGSIFFGYVTKDMMIGVGTPFYGSSIFTLPGHVGLLDAEFMPIFIKWVPVLLSFGGAFIALVAYSFFSRRMSEIKLSRLGGCAYTFLNNKWHFDYVYNAYVVKPLIGFGYNTSYKVLDRGLIE
jgi:NADH-ubiquinone oxidoreductase chain 5